MSYRNFSSSGDACDVVYVEEATLAGDGGSVLGFIDDAWAVPISNSFDFLLARRSVRWFLVVVATSPSNVVTIFILLYLVHIVVVMVESLRVMV